MRNIKIRLANFAVTKQRKIKQWQRDHLDEAKSRKLYETKPPEINNIQQRIVNDLNSKGISIVNINDLFPDNIWWEKLSKEANEFINSPEVVEFAKRFKNKDSIKGFATDNYAKKYLYRKYNIDRKKEINFTDIFLQFGIEEKILDIVGAYFGRYGRLRMIDLWYNLAVGKDAPTQSQKWHRDGEDSKLIKLFLYFNDVDEETGPFTYIPESHLNGKYADLWPGEVITRRSYGGIYPDESDFDSRFNKGEIKECTGKAGTMIFCDTYGFHRGGYCTTKDRIAGNWVYTTPSSFCENTSPYSHPSNNILLTEVQKFALSFN